MGQLHIVRSQKDLPACTTSTALAARQIYNYSLDSRHIDKKNKMFTTIFFLHIL
jgi:hypothetical protein